MAISVTSLFGTFTGLTPVNNDQGKSNSNYEVTDKCGSVVLAGTLETVGRASTTYNVTADCALSQIELGTIVSNHAIVGVSVSTGAGQQPTVTITGEFVGTAEIVNDTQVTALSGTVDETLCAQAIGDIPDSALNVHLQSASVNFSCTFTRVLGDDGATAAFNITGVKADYSAEYRSTDTSAPTAPTPTATLVITQPVTKAQENTNVDKYTLGFTEYL